MKKYKFMTVNINIIGFGSGGWEHRKIIQEQAELGWSYSGFIPVDMASSGKIREMDLIFERETDEQEE